MRILVLPDHYINWTVKELQPYFSHPIKAGDYVDLKLPQFADVTEKAIKRLNKKYGKI